MAYSKLDIFNLALARMGEASIESVNDDTKRARLCRVFYEPVKDLVLGKFDWTFARSFARLDVLTIANADLPYEAYGYTVPTDCKVMRDIYPRGSRTPWEIFGTILYTNRDTEIIVYYTKDVDDPALFSDIFVSVLSLGLSVYLAAPLSQDKKLVQTLYSQFLAEQADGQESDANIGNVYRAHDETPENDTFVSPDLANWLGDDVDLPS